MASTTERTTAREYDQEIDLLELGGVILNKIWFVIIGLLAGAILAFAITHFAITPQYEAKSTIYIFSKTTSITSLTDIQLGSSLTEDFQIIAQTRDVVESVIDELHLDTNYETLSKAITVNNPTGSHMLTIAVRDADPAMAARISNVLSDKLRDQIADIMNTDRPSVVQRAIAPEQPASPSLYRNTAIGGLVGLLAVAAVVVIGYMLDDSIKNEDDVTKYLGMDVLASFPLVKGMERSSKKLRKAAPSRGRIHSARPQPAAAEAAPAKQAEAPAQPAAEEPQTAFEAGQSAPAGEAPAAQESAADPVSNE